MKLSAISYLDVYRSVLTPTLNIKKVFNVSTNATSIVIKGQMNFSLTTKLLPHQKGHKYHLLNFTCCTHANNPPPPPPPEYIFSVTVPSTPPPKVNLQPPPSTPTNIPEYLICCLARPSPRFPAGYCEQFSS